MTKHGESYANTNKSPSWGPHENVARNCPKTGRRVERGLGRRWASWALPFVGLVSLLWFRRELRGEGIRLRFGPAVAV